MSRFIRPGIKDDPLTTLAAGVWIAGFGFAAGFLGYLGFAPG